MISLFYTLFIAVAIETPAMADTVSIESANAAFLDGNYGDAAQQYQDIIESGSPTGDLFYNMGNSLYKDDRLGEAIASWRMAQWLSPRDGDIAANLETARRDTRDRLNTQPHNAALFWRSSLSPYEQIWLSACGLALLGFGFMMFNRRRRLGQDLPFSQVLPSVALGVPSVVLALSGAAQILALEDNPHGVVVVDEVRVSSAGSGGVVLYELHEGAELEISEKANGYLLVNVSGLGSGWVPESAVLTIDPRG